MPKTGVTLGTVQLRDFEVPENITFGGRQAIAIHRLPGGARVIDTMGRDDTEIVFSGIFTGPHAPRRARIVDAMRASGLPQLLSWDVFSYTVIVNGFRADYRAANWIPFRATCAVLRDETAAVPETPVTLMESLLGDITSAATASVDLTGVVRALASQDASRRGTPAHAQASHQLGTARAGLAMAMAAADRSLPQGELADQAALLTACDVMEQLAELARARAYVGRASVNLAHASV